MSIFSFFLHQFGFKKSLMPTNDFKWLFFTITCVFEKIQKNNFQNFQTFRIFRVKGSGLRVHNFVCQTLPDPRFLPGHEQAKSFLLSQLTHFRRLELKFYSRKNRFKHEKQRHLMVKIKSRTFFVEAHGPFYNLTAVFGRYY